MRTTSERKHMMMILENVLDFIVNDQLKQVSGVDDDVRSRVAFVCVLIRSIDDMIAE